MMARKSKFAPASIPMTKSSALTPIGVTDGMRVTSKDTPEKARAD